MQDRYLGRIEPGMDVCDVNGDKVGTVSRVYRHEMAAVGAGVGSGGLGAEAQDEILEVKTGLLGLGRHLYVPLGAIHDLTTACVFLTKSKTEIDELQDWEHRPDYLDQLT